MESKRKCERKEINANANVKKFLATKLREQEEGYQYQLDTKEKEIEILRKQLRLNKPLQVSSLTKFSELYQKLPPEIQGYLNVYRRSLDLYSRVMNGSISLKLNKERHMRLHTIMLLKTLFIYAIPQVYEMFQILAKETPEIFGTNGWFEYVPDHVLHLLYNSLGDGPLLAFLTILGLPQNPVIQREIEPLFSFPIKIMSKSKVMDIIHPDNWSNIKEGIENDRISILTHHNPKMIE